MREGESVMERRENTSGAVLSRPAIFLEPDGFQYQRNIPYFKMAPLLALQPSSFKNEILGSSFQPNAILKNVFFYLNNDFLTKTESKKLRKVSEESNGVPDRRFPAGIFNFFPTTGSMTYFHITKC
jgi:hypothetical protein